MDDDNTSWMDYASSDEGRFQEPNDDDSTTCGEQVKPVDDQDCEEAIPNKHLKEWWTAAHALGAVYGDTREDNCKFTLPPNGPPTPPTILGESFETKEYSGHVPGYVFATRNLRTGYFRDGGSTPPVQRTRIALDKIHQNGPRVTHEQRAQILQNKITALEKKRDNERQLQQQQQQQRQQQHRLDLRSEDPAYVAT